MGLTMGTCVVYIDEAGSPHSHHIPIQSGETPIFTLAAVAFPLWEWRARDRGFLSLKRQFFQDILGKTNERDEEYEIKGRDLASPRNKTSKRNHNFNRRVLSSIGQNAGCCFGITFIKNSSNPPSHQSIYTHAFQILTERISLFVTEHSAYSNAILICDSRMKGVAGADISVARSHMSYIFGHETGRTFINIMEAPLFADSRLTVGLQIVDIFASNLFTNQYYYYCRNVQGAIDYSHMQAYWSQIDQLQFKSRGTIDGHQIFGYRVVDHRPKPQNLPTTGH
jgi:hypothetical protein